jgi:predicted nucleic acid-binding protein
MIALDSTVIIDLLLGTEAQSKQASAYFRTVREHGGIISAASLTEVAFLLERHEGKDAAAEAVALLQDYSSLNIANVTPEIAALAGSLRANYYHRIRKPLSYIDAIILATAIKHGASKLVTKDADFEGITELKIERY